MLKTIMFFSLLSLFTKEKEQVLRPKLPDLSEIQLREVLLSDKKTKELINLKEQELKLEHNSLYKLIYNESRFNPKAYNPKTDAVGLIQFLPTTRAGLGYTKEQLSNMTFQEQLNTAVTDYIKRIQRAYNIHYEWELRLAIVYPYALLQRNNLDYVLGSEKSMKWAKAVREGNYPLDIDNNGYITIQDVINYCKN